MRELFQRELLFEESLFGECHASTLVELENGEVVVCFFAGTKEGNDDVSIWMIRGSMGSWGLPKMVAKIRNQAHWNPVLFNDSGVLYLYFKVGETIWDWETWCMTSKDGGLKWSDCFELVPGDRGGRGPVKNKPIVLSNGSWLAPASIEEKCGDESFLWDAFVDRSIDLGKTWNRSDLIRLNRDEFGGEGVIQPTLWESESGVVHMLLRSSSGYILRSDSDDFGKTWSPAYKTVLPNNNSGLDLVKLPSGVLVLVYNPVGDSWGSRSPIRLSLSFDNGYSWPEFFELEEAAGCEFSYPAVICGNDSIKLCYTWDRKAICYWQCDLHDLEKALSIKSAKVCFNNV